MERRAALRFILSWVRQFTAMLGPAQSRDIFVVGGVNLIFQCYGRFIKTIFLDAKWLQSM